MPRSLLRVDKHRYCYLLWLLDKTLSTPQNRPLNERYQDVGSIHRGVS